MTTPQVEAMPGMTPLGIKPMNETTMPDSPTPKTLEVSVRFECKYQPELCRSEDATRASIVNVWLDKGEETFVATDGCMMSITPVLFGDAETVDALKNTEVDVEGHYSAEQLKKARKLGKNYGYAELIVSKDTIKFNDGSSEPRLKTDSFGQYPNYKQVIPAKDRPEAFAFSLDADLLLKIAKAIGAESGGRNAKSGKLVTLRFESNEAPIAVTCSNSKGAKAILMPVKLHPSQL